VPVILVNTFSINKVSVFFSHGFCLNSSGGSFVLVQPFSFLFLLFSSDGSCNFGISLERDVSLSWSFIESNIFLGLWFIFFWKFICLVLFTESFSKWCFISGSWVDQEFFHACVSNFFVFEDFIESLLSILSLGCSSISIRLHFPVMLGSSNFS